MTGAANSMVWFLGTTVVLAVVLYFPVHKMIWTMQVRRMQRKLGRESTAEEQEAARLKARMFTGVIVITFAFLFNKVLFGPS